LSLLLHFADEAGWPRALARALGWAAARRRLPQLPRWRDRLTLPKPLPPRVVLLRGLQQPNAKLAAC
jgi:ribose-phosphate pyrophosphokinase